MRVRLLLKYRYVVVACARWETPYIREWIAYYEAIGFEHIYLYCNDDDPAEFHREVGLSSVKSRFVTLRHFPGQGQQWAMYRHAMMTVEIEAEWVTFIDIDEFLALRDTDNIQEFMSRYPKEIDTIYFNWLVFGNNNFSQRPPGSVLRQYTTRSRFLDYHTKHISRAGRLTQEKLTATCFPFWHGLENPVWSDMCRINVLGGDWGSYLDDFPRSSKRMLSESKLIDRLLSTATVNHYSFKSETDFLLRVQRGTAGQFGGQLQWAELYRQGVHKRFLLEQSQVRDLYLHNFAESYSLDFYQANEVEGSPLPANTSKQRIMAESWLWKSELELDHGSGRILHCTHGSAGDFNLYHDGLIVKWDDWPTEVFWNFAGIYQMVFRAVTSTVSDAFNSVDLNRVVSCRVDGSTLPVKSVCVLLPDGRELHLRPGTSDILVFSAIFNHGDYKTRDDIGEVTTIVDLGSNIGVSVVYFASRFPGAVIYAVEPELGNFKLLETNVRNLANVVLIKAAIWSHDTECELDTEENGVSREDWAFRSYEVGPGGQRADAISMTSLMSRYGITTIDILKIDIEGAEVELFSVGVSEWLGNVRYLLIETHERFRTGSETIVTQAVAATHSELAPLGENRLFIRHDVLFQ